MTSPEELTVARSAADRNRANARNTLSTGVTKAEALLARMDPTDAWALTVLDIARQLELDPHNRYHEFAAELLAEAIVQSARNGLEAQK